VILLALATAAHGAPIGCAAGASRQVFDEALAAGEVAAGSLDADALAAAIGTANRTFPCLSDPLGTSDVARWYRLRGIERFVAADPPSVARWFGASRALEPAYNLDPSLGGALADAWSAAATPADPWTRPLPPPAEGWLQVDGRRSELAPAARPFVLQRFDGAGAVVGNAVVQPDDPLPSWPIRNGEAPATTRHRSRTLLIAGLATGIGAGASAAGAAALRHSYVASEESADALHGTLTANRVLGFGAVGIGAVAAGLGAGAVVTGDW
jgi:hypothetical protein